MFRQIKKIIKNLLILKKITILSNNCIGAYSYNKIGSSYFSPFVWTNMTPSDFLKLVENFSYYMTLDLEEDVNPNIEKFKSIDGQNINFPVGKLADVTVYFQHSKNFTEAKDSFDRRKKRINYKNIKVILNDVNCTKEDINCFKNLNYKKMFVTSRNDFVNDIKRCEYTIYNNEQNKSWFECKWFTPKLFFFLIRK